MTFMLAACSNEVELYEKHKKYCTERNGVLVVREVKSSFDHRIFKEFCCDVRNKNTKESIIKIDKIVFVLLDEEGKPKAHNINKIKK